MRANVSAALAALEPITRGATTMARCPVHDDRVRSLAIAEKDGKVLLTCHAGCDTKAVVAAMGLSMSDLFEDERPESIVDAIYDYRSAEGQLLYQVIRQRPKTFRQRRPLPGDRWEYNLDGVDRVPYRLPEVVAASEVLVVEGEKDADRLVEAGFTATSNSGGAGKWRSEWAPLFAGKNVVILPDNDEPGREHAEIVKAGLLGSARSVRIVNLPGLPPKGDVSDYLSGHSVDELRALLRPNIAPTVTEFIERTAISTPDLYPDVIPSGGLVIFVGQPRSFKTMAGMQMMFSVASGHPWLGIEPTETGDALYVSEEGAASKVSDRLSAMNEAFQPRHTIHILHRRGIRLAADDDGWGLVKATLDEQENPKFVVLDTLAALMDGDENSVMDIREALRPAQQLITDYGVTVVLVHHVNKGGEGRIGNRMRGSSALWGACDATLGFERDVDGYGDPIDSGVVRVETKDNDPRRYVFDFRPERMVLESVEKPRLSVETLYDEVVRRHAAGTPPRVKELQDYFGVGHSHLYNNIRGLYPRVQLRGGVLYVNERGSGSGKSVESLGI